MSCQSYSWVLKFCIQDMHKYIEIAKLCETATNWLGCLRAKYIQISEKIKNPKIGKQHV